ncbi:hypothetical protein ABW19_dt0207715 [Dactylella cylindrospora]|nr:hypothetical protein ABW19_dt0207715 [Dactylella cylindrospora]
MGVVKNSFPPPSTYNQIPFIHDMEHVAEAHREDLNYLRDLLDKHELPPSVCIKLIHIHFHLNEGEILAVSELDAPPHGQIPFLSPMTPQADTQVSGCHYLVDDAGDLQAFEYTTSQGAVDLTAYPVFVTEFCDAIVQRGLQHKFGLAIKSGTAAQGSWTELDYPEKRATFLLPNNIPIPTSENLTQRTTKTQFYSPKNEIDGTTHSHLEHHHSSKVEETEPVIDGVTTKGGLYLTGMPLVPGTAFHSYVSAISLAA